MTATTIWLWIVLAGGLQYVCSSTDTEPLLLTPYIRACEYYKAREISKVQYFKSFGIDVTAHSGYITVGNDTTEANLFFLLTEVEGNSSDAPLLLWTQGGPGLSALFGLFLENGPVGFTINGNLEAQFYKRINTLQKNMSVLYIDLPVGAGFSFTEKITAYPRTLEDIVEHVEEFLEQFLNVFSEYRGRPFYLAGESYGARYSVAIAKKLLSTSASREGDATNGLKLKGVIGGNGFLGPILETADSSSFLYQASMLTEEGRVEFAAEFEKMKMMLPQNQTLTLGMLFQTIFADFTKQTKTLFQRLTLYDDHASPLFTERPLKMLACFKFINETSAFRKAIHAGETTAFEYNNQYLYAMFAYDWLRDITNITEAVLGKIDVLFYTGQLDALFPSQNQQAYYQKLNWEHAEMYRKAHRSPWTPSQDYYGFAGYVKKATKLVDAVLLGMSHYGAVDKPDEVFYLMTQFIFESSKGLELLSPRNIAKDLTK